MSHFLAHRHLARKFRLPGIAAISLLFIAPCWAAEGCATNQLGHCLKQTYVLQRGTYGTALKIKTKELSPKNSKSLHTKTFANISETRLVKIGNGDGIWHAKVSGLGRVLLKLEIRNGAKLQQTHLIGQINLVHQKDPIAFSYRRSLPDNQQWSWRIVAHPTT